MIVLLLCFFAFSAFSQTAVVDDFTSTDGWRLIASEGVSISVHSAPGVKGNALRIDFNFRSGAGYCGIQKKWPMSLPENYRFSYYLRGQAPSNNLEFKLLDATGDNVWWQNQRNMKFPEQWQKILVKKRNISFAWGPATQRNLSAVDKIEIMIAAGSGGRGSLYIDELMYQELEPAVTAIPTPRVSVTSFQPGHEPLLMVDHDPQTAWSSAPESVPQQIDLDLSRISEIGGFTIDWDNHHFARKYDVLSSFDGQQWERVYRISDGQGGREYIPLKELETKRIRLQLQESVSQGYGIRELTIQDMGFSETPEALYRVLARESRRGNYPRYLLNEQSYWTVVGVPTDRKEALLNEDGSVEVDKSSFSIEPFVRIHDRLFTWSDVDKQQRLCRDFIPIPTVSWKADSFALDITAFASGQAGAANLFVQYDITNCSPITIQPELLLTVRPFQVNPPWQFLNWPGGIAPIHAIESQSNRLIVNQQKEIFYSQPFDDVLLRSFAQGDISRYVCMDHWPEQHTVQDSLGFASAAMRWKCTLPPATRRSVTLMIPFDGRGDSRFFDTAFMTGLQDSIRLSWRQQVNQVQLTVPPAGQKMVDVLRSNLAYILINRDGPGIQPGSRSYDRSWIRDGSLTSAALLRFGITEPVKEFIEWYAQNLFPSGKAPCVVDQHGPDPVPENDSNGQFIFAVWQYYRFTHDIGFLQNQFNRIKAAVAYMDSMTDLRSSDYYRHGNDSLHAFYGLLPESISHEGYSAKPMHSYWDDFFALLGYKNAVDIAHILQMKTEMNTFACSRDRFQKNLYASLAYAFKNNKIDYIPGCVELGDFDATSTSIALFPCEEWHHLPQPQATNTFARYFDYFTRRLDPLFSWRDFTPYEVRLIGSFIRMDEPEKAWQLIDFFLSCQRPAGWNHWAEIVWKEERLPRFIGDMPHTWCGSDFINSVRMLFVYEDEVLENLVLGAGLPASWLDTAEGVEVKNMPTYYGLLNYSIKRSGNGYRVSVSGNLQLPKQGLALRWWKAQPPRKVWVNGRAIKMKNKKWIQLKQLPALVEIW